MNKSILFVVCMLFLFSIPCLNFIENASAASNVEDLDFSEGKKYVYFYETSVFNHFYGVYVINETDIFWKGVTVDVYNESVQLVGFILYKNNLSLHLSGIIDVEDVLNDNISYYKLDSPGSSSSFTFSIPIVNNQEAYNFNFSNLKEKGSTKDMWGGMELNLELETDNFFTEYNAYKLTVGVSNSYALYYLSNIEPYLLIDWDSFVQGKQVTSISLQSVEDILFSEIEYKDFINYSREEASKSKVIDFEDGETDTSDNDDNGIPGFESIIIFFVIGLVIFCKRKKK